ncbi:MAG: HAD family hydrolase [Thermoplasmatota archaeon]
MGTLEPGRLRAVLFDLDDTLVNWRAAEAGAIASLAKTQFAPLGFAGDTVRTAYDGVMEENIRSWSQLRRWWYISERLQLLSERLGTADRLPGTALADAFSRDVSTRLCLLDGATDALRRARAGRRTALLTNGRSESQRPKVEAFALEAEVDFVGISGELGHWKPDAAAFHAVLDRLRVRPEEALMVGDSIDFDILPAKALGMQTAWVNPAGASHPQADVVVATPGHLVGHLG